MNSVDLSIVRSHHLAPALRLIAAPSVSTPLTATAPPSGAASTGGSVFTTATTPITPERVSLRRRGALLDFQ